MPCDYSKYPPNWKSEIRPRILARAGEVRDTSGNVTIEACCEFCGVENRKEGWRFPSGAFISPDEFAGIYIVPQDESAAEKILKRKPYKICLTIAHLDHDKENWSVKDERLKALCQGCHLSYDRSRHMAKSARLRAEKKYKNSLFNQQ